MYKAINDLLLYLDKKEIPMHALLIMHKNELVCEKYFAPYKADTLHRMFSISKSFTALAISLLADEGKVSLDAPITDYFPEYTDAGTHPYIKATTIRNMLMMRTCHASCTYKVNMKSNWVQSFFTTAPTHKPGTVFHYDTSAAHVLCALVEKLTGMTMLDYLKEKAYKYLGFRENSYMIKDPFGVSMGGSGLMATPMDIMKVLQLLANSGTIICNDGVSRTLFNPDFVKTATSNLTDTIMTGPVPSEACGYGYMIWINEKGGFVLYGMGGQLAISIPDHDLLIVTCADTQGIAGGNQVIYDGIYDILLPAIDNEAAPQENTTETASTLQIMPPRLPGSQAAAARSAAFWPEAHTLPAKYLLDENKSGFKELSISISEGFGKLEFTKADGNTMPIDFGIEKMQEGRLVCDSNPDKKDGTHYVAGAIWLRDNVLFIKVHLIDESVGSIRFELFFEQDDITVFMRKIEETYFQEFDGHLHGTII